uniref:Suppressor of white apricot N-terminal domain-containing protein n=1 Tax=Serinus canaria TaxID=9135 RepID=A0A8C9N1B0_SERCA
SGLGSHQGWVGGPKIPILIPKSPQNSRFCSSPEQESDERKCNYERYRGLVQNDFAGISEEQCLYQIYIDELYGGLQKPNEDEKKKLAEKKASIGYTYEDSTVEELENSLEKRGGDEEDSEEDSNTDEDEVIPDIDVEVDVDELNQEQVADLNKQATTYGMAEGDFVRMLRKDKEEAEAIKNAKALEEEKAMYSVREKKTEKTGNFLLENPQKFLSKSPIPPPGPPLPPAAPGIPGEAAERPENQPPQVRLPAFPPLIPIFPPPIPAFPPSNPNFLLPNPNFPFPNPVSPPNPPILTLNPNFSLPNPIFPRIPPVLPQIPIFQPQNPNFSFPNPNFSCPNPKFSCPNPPIPSKSHFFYLQNPVSPPNPTFSSGKSHFFPPKSAQLPPKSPPILPVPLNPLLTPPFHPQNPIFSPQIPNIHPQILPVPPQIPPIPPQFPLNTPISP